ncbi:MAG: restriction endonuclease subunit S [Chitinophagales bacterium]
MKQGKLSEAGISGLKDGQDLATKKILPSSNPKNLNAIDMKQGATLSLPKGWEIKKLGEVCEVIAGQSPEGKFYNSEGKGMPFYQGKKEYGEKYIGEPTTWTTKITKEAEAGDILMSVRAPVGPVNFATQKICIGRGLAAIRAGKNIDKEFLFNYLIKHESEIEGNAGAVFNSINKTQIENLKIPLPPLPEQQRIVSILDKVFSVIERSRNNAEQNLKNAKELFESYLQGVFEKKGDGWEEKRIDEICQLINGRAYKKDELLSKGKYRVLRVGNFFTNDHWYYSDLELDENKYCDKEDLLYAWSASFGPRIWKEEKVIYHYHIWKVIPDENLVTRDFLFTLFEWDKEKIKAAQGTGTTMIHVSKGSMENRIVPIPPLKTQQTIVRQLDALRAETQKLEAVYQKKIEDLEELKKSILQKAFSGQLSELGFDKLKDDRIIEKKKILQSSNPKNLNPDNL